MSVNRITGYGASAIVIAGLIYAGFVHETDADPMTLLGSATVQIRLASSFPRKDKAGQPNAARQEMLDHAREFVNKARKQAPDLHAGIELDAHLSYMDGDYKKAANLFREAQGSRESTPESSVIDRLNEARMWRAAEDPEKALEVLEQISEFLVSHATTAQLQRAHVLVELGRGDEAVDIATRLAWSAKDSATLVDAGLMLESQKETEIAEAAFRAAAESEPTANYYVARLKIYEEDFDRGLELLKRAVSADGRLVRSMLTRDSETWEAVAEDERFKGLFTSSDEPAKPGR
jgi:tetratricopeptide (TPR) repeat protein